jgi:inosose dehydratase
MTLPVTITCAPCCWGVDDVSNPHLPHWESVLDEAAEAGFGGLELGPSDAADFWSQNCGR